TRRGGGPARGGAPRRGARPPAPPPVAALADDQADPAQLAHQTRRVAARDRALLVGAVAGITAVTVALLALVVPRGTRRRWRPAGPA
ncbi:type VII secretion-associated serine protease mycosin, partial [Micromonospora sp. NPDC049089]